MTKSVGLALILYCVFCIIALAFGQSPRFVLALLFEGTWGSAYGIGQVLFKATPLLLAAVAVHIALANGLFNVGVEGQLALASLAVGVAGARLAFLPSFILLPSLLIIAGGVGASWAFFAAWLRVRAKAHEVITTILLNRVADSLVGFGLVSGLAVAGTVRTADLGQGAMIPRLSAVAATFKGSAANFSIFISLALVILLPWFFKKTVLGREWVLVGQGERACQAVGIDVARRRMQAFVASGAVAGLIATCTVLGYKGYFEQGLGAGAGFTGIAVALLGRGRPVPMCLAALFFGTLEQGGLAVNAYLPREAMQILIAISVVGSAALFALSTSRRTQKEAT